MLMRTASLTGHLRGKGRKRREEEITEIGKKREREGDLGMGNSFSERERKNERA